MFEVTLNENTEMTTIVFVENCVDQLDVEDALLEMGFNSRVVATAVIKEMAV